MSKQKPEPAIRTGLARRIIPCLDVKDGMVVKGVQFREHKVVGDIVDLSMRYRDEGADELVLYDITASPEARTVDTSWVERIARVIDIPFCVAGGIRNLESAKQVLNSGADKISINSPAIANPELINTLAQQFGSQCIVIGIDSFHQNDQYFVKSLTGNPDTTKNAGLDTMEWVKEVQDRGAGEIVLNCMNQDGVRKGYDIRQLELVRRICQVPMIASGGAGAMDHFFEVFDKALVDGALAASVFHNQIFSIPQLKRYLQSKKIAVRI